MIKETMYFNADTLSLINLADKIIERIDIIRKLRAYNYTPGDDRGYNVTKYNFELLKKQIKENKFELAARLVRQFITSVSVLSAYELQRNELLNTGKSLLNGLEKLAPVKILSKEQKQKHMEMWLKSIK